VVTEDRAVVLDALKRGQCDGLLPAACGFLDAFVACLDEHGLLELFEQFPDPRKRRSIGPEFFCLILLHKALFRLDSLAQIGTVLFHSPDVLRRLGFNLRQIHEGFYHGSAQRPFNPEALADFFDGLSAKQLCEHQQQFATRLCQQFSVLAQNGVAVLDANTTTVPAGHYGRPPSQFKTCVLGLCRLDDAQWVPADPPVLHATVAPQRALCPLRDLDSWEACTVPLQGVVIRDTYPDRVQYQCLVTTDLDLTPKQLHSYARDRWSIEESFMDLTRYWGLDQLGSCRPAVAHAQIHFLFLAYTLLHLYAWETQAVTDGSAPPRPRLLPGREITAYFGNHYVILLPSELFTIVFDPNDAWLANREQLLAAMRFCEGQPPPRAPRLNTRQKPLTLPSLL
jgi:hypothetical protein